MTIHGKELSEGKLGEFSRVRKRSRTRTAGLIQTPVSFHNVKATREAAEMTHDSTHLSLMVLIKNVW